MRCDAHRLSEPVCQRAQSRDPAEVFSSFFRRAKSEAVPFWRRARCAGCSHPCTQAARTRCTAALRAARCRRCPLGGTDRHPPAAARAPQAHRLVCACALPLLTPSSPSPSLPQETHAHTYTQSLTLSHTRMQAQSALDARRQAARQGGAHLDDVVLLRYMPHLLVPARHRKARVSAARTLNCTCSADESGCDGVARRESGLRALVEPLFDRVVEDELAVGRLQARHLHVQREEVARTARCRQKGEEGGGQGTYRALSQSESVKAKDKAKLPASRLHEMHTAKWTGCWEG
eukprot:1619756-Rhodomonas_salina.3